MEKFDQAIDKLKFNADGLIPAVVIDAEGKVLMVAYMNAESLARTLETGRTHFWSRSRGKYWAKGESSGHVQHVRVVYTDCDMDTLLVEVDQNVAACHKGYYSCFYRRLNDEGKWEVIADKVFEPKDKYST